jgi:glycosyltransferase involved in cell wall biosynthesis
MASNINEFRIVITACVYNVAQYLEKNMNKLLEIRSMFHNDSVIVIAENDSTDNTKSILKRFEKNTTPNNIHVLNLDGLMQQCPVRTERLAVVRNTLLNHVHTKYSSYDYMIIVDMDDVLNEFNPKDIEKCFIVPLHLWDAMFANTRTKYYDIWALRSKELGITYDCWDMFSHLCQAGISPNEAKNLTVRLWQKELPRKKPIRVESAFGGVGVYRISKTVSCEYNGKTTECSCNLPGQCRQDTCEHVSFHRDMIEKNQAKLYIHPLLFVSAPKEHI